MPYFKNRGWLMKNLLGNWEVAPIYIYQTGALVTPQSGIDANLNGDSASDEFSSIPRAVRLSDRIRGRYKTAPGRRSRIWRLIRAEFVSAPRGTLPNAGRNLLSLNPIDNIDLTLAKHIDFGERWKLEFAARVFNLLNHSAICGRIFGRRAVPALSTE